VTSSSPSQEPTSSPGDKADSSANGHPLSDRVSRFLFPIKLPPPANPALLKHTEERAEDAQNRIADRITAFSGSMTFVYIHIVWFGCWIGFGVEKYPFGLLTMIVSLEAIFLSTFVMISQNRADAKRQVIADQQWKTVQEEDRQNKELLDLSNQILNLTKEVRSYGDTVQETLALTKEVHALSGSDPVTKRYGPPPQPF
jgi:uncharacterized membrane protein